MYLCIKTICPIFVKMLIIISTWYECKISNLKFLLYRHTFFNYVDNTCTQRRTCKKCDFRIQGTFKNCKSNSSQEIRNRFLIVTFLPYFQWSIHMPSLFLFCPNFRVRGVCGITNCGHWDIVGWAVSPPPFPWKVTQ